MSEISIESAGAVTAKRAEIAPAVGKTQEIFDKRLEMINESDSPLSLLAGEEAPTKKFIDGVAKEKIGEPDKDGKLRRNQEQRDKLTRVDSISTILTKIAKGEVTPAMVGNPIIIGAVESLITQHPNFLTSYNALGPLEKNKFVENLLKDINTRSEIIRLLNERVILDDVSERDNITRQKAEVERLSGKKSEFENEKQNLEIKKQNDEQELQKFESKFDQTTNSIVQGEYSVKLTELESKINPLAKRSSSLTSEIEILNASIQETQQARTQFVTSRVGAMSAEVQAILGDYDGQIEKLKTELSRKIKNQKTTEQQLANAQQEKKSLEDRQITLESSVAKIDDRLSILSTEIKEISPDLIEARTTLRGLLANKNTNEEEFVSKIESILSESLKSTLQIDLTETYKAEKSIDEKAKTDAKTQIERTVREAIIARYQLADGINWANFGIDYVTFLDQGPDNIIGGVLPVGTNLDVFRTENPDLYKEISEDLTKKMARLRLQQPRDGRFAQILLGPRPISHDEILAIVNRFDEATFTSALKTNAEFKKLIESAGKDKVLNLEGKVTDKIKKLPMGSILLALAALLGIGIFKGVS